MNKLTTIPAQRDVDGLAVIGRTKHALMGIRYADDEGGDAAAAQAAAAAEAAKGGDDAPWTKDNFDPERAFKLVGNLRADLAAEKTKREADIAAATDNATKAALAQFAKLISGEEAPETDPTKLAAKITDLGAQVADQNSTITQAQADIKARDLLLVAASVAAGQANVKLLLANEDFKTSIASVEPTDEGAIQAKIDAALQANPALKATPGRSGSDGHNGGQTADLKAQLAAAEKAGDNTLAISLKRRIYAAASNNH